MAETSAAATLAASLAPLALPERLSRIRAALPGRLVFTTSFGIEDQLLTHHIAEAGHAIEIVTLDTGRLFPETLDLWAATEMRYGRRIAAIQPESPALIALLGEQGPLGFRASIDARKACCAIRKVGPLNRALEGASGWITGLRADQSAARAEIAFAETDAAHGLVKVNPLADHTREHIVAETIRLHVPVNALHKRGFLSIGCAPCTRAIAPGETERAGRWWWEAEAQKECGLHVGADGRLRRAAAQEVCA